MELWLQFGTKCISVVSREEESDKLVELQDLITKEEMFWRQQSRKVYLKEGDRNTKFFHMTTLQNRMANRISKINMDDGLIDKEEIIKREARMSFGSLLQCDLVLNFEKQHLFLESIPSCISRAQNSFLSSIPSLDEISKAIFSFKGDKASGPNGFPLLFFHKYWHIIGTDVCNGVKEFFGSRNLLRELNGTFISLIPKKPGADYLDQFRPISLCNSFYKIISKFLTLRIISIRPAIIFRQKNSFFLGRHILDSIISIDENIHSLMVSKKEGFLLKLDLSKEYDRFDWNFLLRGMEAFGLPQPEKCVHVQEIVSIIVYLYKKASEKRNIRNQFWKNCQYSMI